MIQFLQDQYFLYERIKKNIDIHPSNRELKEFQRLAKEIDKDRYFTIYGCQDCIRTLVKFVYDNQKTIIKRETFFKEDNESKN